jgi:isoquinoline 1-oxidoreductase subunit alpha
MPYEIRVNGTEHTVDVDGDTPLLWVLRDALGLNGTKFGCGIGACGACTLLVDGQAARSCLLPIGHLDGAAVTTIEGMADSRHRRIQTAWVEEDVPECGYCQSGMIMATAALLATNPNPTDAEIDAAITNICRCGTYPPVVAAIQQAANTEKRANGGGQ